MRKIDFKQADESLYAISTIPAIVVAAAFALWYSVTRLSSIYPPGSSFNPVLWDMLPYFIVPTLVLSPLSFFITFELGYRMRMKTHLQAKRLMGRIIIQGVGVTVFVAIYTFLLVALLPFTSASITLVSASLTFSILIFLLMKRFKKTFTELEKGEW